MKWLPLLTGFALLATGCASQSTEGSRDTSTAQSKPINCATAEADLRVLKSEQDHATQMDQAMGGGTTMVPSGLVTEPEFGTSPIGAGEYSDYLGDRIAQIQETCGL